MPRRRRLVRPVVTPFPADFPDRLVRFKEAGGWSWRTLARLAGVRPYRVREWRRGVVPDSPQLFRLLTLADECGLLGILLARNDDPTAWREPCLAALQLGFAAMWADDVP